MLMQYSYLYPDGNGIIKAAACSDPHPVARPEPEMPGRKGFYCMSGTVAQGQTARTIRLVTMPVEHGGWAFMLEPILAGCILALSGAGLWLSVATAATFMVRQPLKTALIDRRNGKRFPRTLWAERFAALFALVAGAALVLALLTARAPFWLPILLAAPFALLQAYFDLQRQSRQLAAELAGAVAIGAGSAAITLAGGWAVAPALALWAILAARAVTSVLYVRARLRLEREGGFDKAPVLVSHAAALAIIAGLAVAGWAPWLALLAILILTARAAWGLSPWRRSVRAQVIGTQELGAGLLTVALTVIGYIFSL
jgi:hypothetical protein